MKYGKKKTAKVVKKKKKKGILMTDNKDVTVHVTGVSMSGGVKNDNKRSAPADQKQSGKETA